MYVVDPLLAAGVRGLEERVVERRLGGAGADVDAMDDAPGGFCDEDPRGPVGKAVMPLRLRPCGLGTVLRKMAGRFSERDRTATAQLQPIEAGRGLS